MAESLRVKAVVEYDGTDYQGFQLQAAAPTVQGALEKGLKAVAGEPIRVIGSGRTDAGVHAQGQVVHFDINWGHRLLALQRAWNASLPRDIAVRGLEAAPAEFHARFSAWSREYRYCVYLGPERRPLMQRFAHHLPQALDALTMAEAARELCGRHDFSAFGRPPAGTNAVRTVYRATWQRQGEMLYFDITADAFLRHMVRIIVGTLLLVGMGRLTARDVRAILLARDLNHPQAAAPACGLCLMRVNYR